MQGFCGSKSAISPPFESKSAIPPLDCLLDAGLKACRRRPPLSVLIVGDIEALCAVFPFAQIISHTAAS